MSASQFRRLWLLRLRRRIAQFTAGGRWTDRLAPAVRHNLRWFWIDGVFAQAAESITLTYTALYMLALGATRGQIGWMTALSSLSAALLLLPGAALARQRDRRKLVCLGAGGAARAMILLTALLPLALSGPAAVRLAITLVVIREAFANLTLPAWTALTADIVPLAWRGRYFGSRNIAMGLAGMAITLVVGQLISRVGSPAGYQLAMGLAFALGLVSTLSFARLTEPSDPLPPLDYPKQPRRSLFHHLRAHPDFLTFCGVAALWNFSLNVAGPFF
ncbi:MAG: MFS transporter, partial [Anaerolineales bacterium]